MSEMHEKLADEWFSIIPDECRRQEAPCVPADAANRLMDDSHQRPEFESDKVLQAALTDAFSSAPAQPNETAAPVQPAAPPSESVASSGELVSNPGDPPASENEEWKSEYDSYVSQWRAQSAEAREKAEKSRKRWSQIREAEQAEAALHAAAESKLEDKEPSVPAGPIHTPSPADVRDLVSGEAPKQERVSSTAPLYSQSHSRNPTGEDSQYINVPSESTSSYPSMSFPDTPPHPYPHSKPDPPKAEPLSATVAIFDSSLSTRTRVTALFSSLSINFLLPFVNGVMLGFGEIFAKNVLSQWLGWPKAHTVPNAGPVPGSVAAAKGIGIEARSALR